MSGKGRSQELRIIGGKWKGRKVRIRGDRHLRPTPGRTRETLFNWLRGHLDGARCLDAFAGSGVLGIEALSQGAAHCVFIERNRTSATQLKHTLAEIDSDPNEAAVFQADAVRFNRHPFERYGVIFLDPPFGEPDLLMQVLDALLPWIGDWVYVEQRAGQMPAEETWTRFGLAPWRTTRSGDSEAVLLRSLARLQGGS